MKSRYQRIILQSVFERQEYAIGKSTIVVDQSLKEWSLKVAQRQNKLKLQDEQIANDIARNGQQKEDIFHWLHLKTKYDKLVSKLRVMIMEQINEYENQLRIMGALKKMDDKEFTQQDKIELVGVRKIQTREIVVRTDPHAAQLIKSLNRGPKIVSVSQNILEPTYIKEGFTWNDELEEKFLKERKSAKTKYCSNIPSSAFNQMACVPLFPQVSPDDPKHIQRDAKMAQYANGDWLTAHELKFLANSSQLLNSCVDQNLIKQALKTINPNQIDYLETNLAEQIIYNFEDMVAKIHNARIQYIKVKIQNQKRIICEIQNMTEKNALCELNRKKNAKLGKRLQVICEKMTQNISIKDQVYKNVYAQIFVKMIQMKVKKIRDRKQEGENQWNNLYRIEQKLILQRKQKFIDLSKPKKELRDLDKRRKYHPASKLSYFAKTQANEAEQETVQGKLQLNRQKVMDEKVKDYRMRILDIGLNEKKNFIKFYSSGPSYAMRSEPLFVMNYDQIKKNIYEPNAVIELTSIELKALILIQKSVRRYISFKYLRNYKEIYYQKKFKAYHKFLEDRFFGNRWMNVLKQLQIMKLNPELGVESSPKNEDIGLILKTNESIGYLQTATSEIPNSAMSRDGQSEHRVFRKSASLSQSSYIFQKKKESPKKLTTAIRMSQTTRLQNIEEIPKKMVEVDNHHKQISKLLIKHQRLLRYSKINMLTSVIKAGFVYSSEDVNVKDEINNTALYYASKNVNVQFVEYLLHLGANPNMLCCDNTPMHLALKSGNINIIMQMLDKGGNLNVLNHDQQTPLMFASDTVLRNLGMENAVCSIHNNFTGTSFNNHTFLKKTKSNSFGIDDQL